MTALRTFAADAGDRAAELVRVAREYRATPFAHMGRHRTGGVDCVGLLIAVCRDIRIANEFEDIPYGLVVNGWRMQKGFEKHCLKVPKPWPENTRPGDFLFIAFNNFPMHAAIVGDTPDGGLSMIHAFRPANAVIEHPIDDVWWERIRCVYRLQELA
jgi:cell wall-associated NlpC family hydrolase